MATLIELIKSTQKFKKQLFISADRIRVHRVNTTKSAGVRNILYSAVTRDVEPDAKHATTSGSGRSCQLQFTVPKGADFENYIPSIANDPVRVRSSSPWYKFAFAYPNKDIGAHFGRISPFTVKGTGKPVNPDRMPGLDKHLIGMIKILKNSGKLRD